MNPTFGWDPTERRARARPAVLLAVLVLASWGCSREPSGSPPAPAAGAPEANPAAAGFDEAGSDPRAIELADATMAAMGGRNAWDMTRHVAWNFFGYRFLVWDKWTGNARIEMPGKDGSGPVVVGLNIGSRLGRAWVDGVQVKDPDELARLLEQGYEAWVNDSYWLFMPYKLKDTGVTLRYVGQADMADGRPADVLELTFRSVGVTPENKYRVYVARESGLVEQWDFYAQAADPEPRFQTPWHDWKRYGEILLSGDRGQRQITEISVHPRLPLSVYESPEDTGLHTNGPVAPVAE